MLLYKMVFLLHRDMTLEREIWTYGYHMVIERNLKRKGPREERRHLLGHGCYY